MAETWFSRLSVTEHLKGTRFYGRRSIQFGKGGLVLELKYGTPTRRSYSFILCFLSDYSYRLNHSSDDMERK